MRALLLTILCGLTVVTSVEAKLPSANDSAIS